MKDNRPVNLDISTMRLPITAWASITHRVTGVILFVAMAVLIWVLDASLSSPESFASLVETMGHPLVKLVLWGIFTAMMYHSVAGIKHLVADFGIGETMEGGVLGARLVIAVTIVLALLGGAWIW
ncbi:MAG: succinate dehydrogenase, cytochrome b556 subunit [Halioglobus sp.]